MKTIDNINLQSGAHKSFEQGVCALELVSWLADEPFSDHPTCTSPVIASYVRTLNDRMPFEHRQKLKPYLTKLVGSVNPALEKQRHEHLAWAAITQFAPSALDIIGLSHHAQALRNVPLHDWAKAKAAATAAYAADAADAAYAADAAARAAAYAAYAYAAYAYAAYAAYAADAAAYAADAAAYAAKTSIMSSDEIWDMALNVLQQVLEIKE